MTRATFQTVDLETTPEAFVVGECVPRDKKQTMMVKRLIRKLLKLRDWPILCKGEKLKEEFDRS
jgi:hypothetical protein